MAGAKVRFWLYLLIASTGLVTAWIFNGLAVMGGQDYGKAWTATAVDLVLTYDLGLVAIAGVVFMFAEARRIGMKRAWIYVLLSSFTAMAFSFPLFLAMRERHLLKVHDYH
ncbi:MAG: DUF2834 domain-containing protein [Micrococcales bacterium]